MKVQRIENSHLVVDPIEMFDSDAVVTVSHKFQSLLVVDAVVSFSKFFEFTTPHDWIIISGRRKLKQQH